MKRYEYGFLMYRKEIGYMLFDKYESDICSHPKFLIALEYASEYGWEVVQRYNNDDWLMKKEIVE